MGHCLMYNRPNIGMFIKVRMLYPDGHVKKKRHYPPFSEVYHLYFNRLLLKSDLTSYRIVVVTVIDFNADNYMELGVVVLRRLLC